MNDCLLLPTFFCPKPWAGMTGGETSRFCSYCKKNVHNLAALSAQERLALVGSPAGSICARYRIAIRRPVKGKEESYARHLLKYGVGVAVAGSALVTFWEIQERDGRGTFYRTFIGDHRTGCRMPDDLYEEYEGPILGIVAFPTIEAPLPDLLAPEATGVPPHVDVKFDALPLGQLGNPLKPRELSAKVLITL